MAPKNNNLKNQDSVIVSRPLPNRLKNWLIRFTSIIIIPLLLILFLELTLRLFGYGTSSKFVFKAKVNGELCYVPNDDFTQKYFGRNMGRSSAAFAIPVNKKPNTIRIFLLGSSAAKGDPAEAYSMSEMLKVMLKEEYPQTNFEVINVGMTAINSHVIYQVAKECSKLDPDLFVIYAGNNEVVGPFGPGTVFSPLLSNIKLIRTLAAFKATRIGQLFTNLFSFAGNNPKEWGGMEMFLKKRVYYNSPDLQVVYKHFRRNLNDICILAEEKNIPVVISSVGVNMKDCSPFAGTSQNQSPVNLEKFEEISRLGQKLEGLGRFQQALDMFAEGLITDSTSANLWFEIANCYDQMGEYAKARECYRKSMDLDALRFRADSKINEIIKNIAQNKKDKHIYFANAEDTLIDNGQNGIMGRDLFYDHVHLRFEGNYLVAKTLLDQVSKTSTIKNLQIKGAFPTQNDCKRKLGFTGWDEVKLCQDILSRYSRAPFINQIGHTQDVKLLGDELKEKETYSKDSLFPKISADYEYSIHYDPTNWFIYLRYADFLQEAEGNYKKAEILLFKVNDLIKHPSIDAELGNVYIKQGKYDEAINYYKKVVRQLSKSAAAYGNLALGYSMKGDYNEALDNYRKALRLNPDYNNIHFGIANVLLKQGKYSEALSENKKEIKVNLYSPQVYELLGQIFEKLDSLDKAEQAYQLAFRLDPFNIDYNKERAEILSKLGRYKESVVHYKFIALKSDTSSQANVDCGNALARTGNFKEAIFFYSRAVRIDPKNYATYNNMGNIYQQLQKPDSAVYFYKKTLAFRNNMPALYVNLGMAYLNVPDYDNAMISFNEALVIDSNFYAAHIGKGAIYDYEANPDLAEIEYKKAIKTEPNNGIGYKKLGLILINKNEFENAIETINKAHDLLPGDDDINGMLSLAYFKYGNSLYVQQKYGEAIPQMEKALQYNPGNTKLNVVLAWAYYKQAHFEAMQNNTVESMRLLENAVKVYPGFVEANYNLGIMLLQQNQTAEAYKYIKQVYDLNPKYQQVAAIYEKLKDK
jgi:tetratricopeptide (TPR) repeat protein